MPNDAEQFFASVGIAFVSCGITGALFVALFLGVSASLAMYRKWRYRA